MSTVRKFSEQERNYHKYQARQNFLREQQTIQGELKQAVEEKEAALKALEALAEKP